VNGAPETFNRNGGPKHLLEFKELLAELSADDHTLPDPTDEPGRAFRRLYDEWVTRGGYQRGKPRHSVRNIKLWLGADNEVRSLEPKLAGTTKLQKQDAIHLLQLFLTRWTYDAERKSYQPYTEGGIRDLAKQFAQNLYQNGAGGLILPLRSRSKRTRNRKESASPALRSSIARPSRDVLMNLHASSDALIIISRERTLIGPDPARSMKLFRSLMKELHDIDQEHKGRRALIWVVDIGLRTQATDSVQGFLNVISLLAQFQALALIDRSDGFPLWEWLSRRAIILIGGLSRIEIDHFYAKAGIAVSQNRPEEPWFSANRLFFDAVPERWLEDDQIVDAFSKQLGELWKQRTITAHLSLKGWNLEHSPEIDPEKDLRYLFHAPLAKAEEGAHCVELGQLGESWSNTFRLACTAAFSRLGWDKTTGPVIDPNDALWLLRRQHFAALTLQDAVRLVNNLIDFHSNDIHQS